MEKTDSLLPPPPTEVPGNGWISSKILGTLTFWCLKKLRRKIMAKGLGSQKMVKKPKKDTSPPKAISVDAVRPTVVTQVPLRGKAAKLPKK